MQSLLIEQRGPSGLMKTWKLHSEHRVLSFGRSKKADLRSMDQSIHGIQGLFEFKNGKWHYINLQISTLHPELNNQTEFCIEKDCEIKFGTCHLAIKVLDAKPQLFSNLENSETVTAAADKKAYQLYTVYAGDTFLESKLIPVFSTFTSQFDPQKTIFKPEKSTGWKVTEIGNLRISQRTIYLNGHEDLSRLPAHELVDEDSKKPMIFTFVCAAILGILFVTSPKESALDEILTPLPPQVQEFKIQPPKKKAQSAPQQPVEQEQKAAAAPKPAQQNAASKSSSMIKNLASGRITQLVGKVSAAAAKSVNVVVTSGEKAGSKNTGRALAAVGALSKSGKDWTSEGKGSGITVSTAGKAGGKGTSEMGQLAGGKAGTGGVGLLEDEGEITGGLDRDVIAQYIKSQLGQILYCYERQLSAQPDLYGKVAVKFTISGDGGVETQRIGDSSLKSAMVEGCILQRVAKWKFPAPEGGTKVLVTYPFLFKSTN